VDRLQHLATLADLAARYARGEDVRADLAKLAETMGGGPQLSLVAPAAEAESPRDVALRVFGYWQKRTGHHRAKMTPERARKILARLREGYSEDDLRRAIDGCAASAFHSGLNDSGVRYDDLELILRTGSNVERFRELNGGEAPIQTEQDPEAAKRASLMAEAKRLRAAGDVDGYNRIIRSLA